MKGERFLWTDEEEKELELIKLSLTSAPILVLPDFHHPFKLHSDASKVTIGAVLNQTTNPSPISVKDCQVPGCSTLPTIWSFIQ